MASFLIDHNIPFISYDHLTRLIKSVCPDSKIAAKIEAGRTKAIAPLALLGKNQNVK